MAFKGGVVLGPVSLNATGAATSQINGIVNIATDNSTNAVTIATGTSARSINIGRSAAAHVIVFGNTNTTTSVDIASGTGNMILNSAGTNTLTGTGGVTIQSTNTAIGITSGTGTISISADAAATTVNVATGAAAKVATLGSTNGASSLALRYGTADFTLASATGTVMSALDTGEITYPLQPAFLAFNSATDTNQTGAGATATVDFDTEVFDQNGDFSADTFTAPVTARYYLSSMVNFSSLTAAMTTLNTTIVTSNRTYYIGDINTGTARDGGSQLSSGSSALADMDVGDTATVQVLIANGAGNTAGITGSATLLLTYFSGHLAC